MMILAKWRSEPIKGRLSDRQPITEGIQSISFVLNLSESEL